MKCGIRIATAACVVVAACGDATGSDAGRVAVRFGTESPGSASASVADGGSALALALADELVTVGTNGTLKIEDIQLIVSEVTLKRAENAACRHENKERGRDNDECKKFEGGPFLVDLPLGGGVVTVLEESIPAGTFRAVEFEVDDFEMDDDDDDSEHRRASALFAALRVLYPNVPARANMVVKGVFTPTTGAPRPFIVYFDADLEIKARFEEPMRVEEGGGITIRIDPAKWFKTGNRVRDLSALNGQLVEFELEMKQGFVKVECDR